MFISFSVLGALTLSTAVLATPKPQSIPKLGAVASETDICSKIGIDILKQGGNAADAIVATQFCVGVIGMYHSGPGGGGFALIHSKRGDVEFIDFRETAPASAFEDMFTGNAAASLNGGLASGVPGELRGLEYIHKTYGKLSWKKLIAPSIKLARYGFTVNEDVVKYMVSVTGTYDFLRFNSEWAIDFAPNGTRVGLGDTLTRKRYANTLESIAEHGPDVFYKGAIANATINALQKQNGTMTLADLANYTIAIRPVSSINYRGYKLYSGSAPSSGAVVLSALKIAEGFDLSTPSETNFSTHYLDEAIRFAYGQRTLLGDPLYYSNLTEYQQKMTSDQIAKELRAKIQKFSTLEATNYNPESYSILSDTGTSAVVAADNSGLTISMTSTINAIFGSKLLVPETGVILNNEMNDFSIPGTRNLFGYAPNPANYARPGARPLSSISPTIALLPNGKPYISVASAGGSRIITAVIQHLWQTLDRGKTSVQAQSKPRFHDQLSPNVVSFELPAPQYGIKGYDNGTVAFIASTGKNVSFVAVGSSTAQALRITRNGTFEAAGEPRQKNSGGYAV